MEVANLGPFRGLPVPHLTPYALAIASKYERVYPWFFNVDTTLTNVAREFRIVTTDPLNYDVLICAAHTQMSDGSNGQNNLLQVCDQKSGYLWTVPGAILGSPASAYGGVNSNVMPIVNLPEAFFLPKNVELKHEWKTYGQASGGSITWLGVALFDRKPDEDPDFVAMPDGGHIRIGERLPWFNTIGLGEEINIAGNPFYALGAGNFFTGFSDSVHRRVSITELVANFFIQSNVTTNPQNVLISFGDKGQPQTWSPRRGPSTAYLGDPITAYPMLPLPIPYDLMPGNRAQIGVLNRNSSTINNAYLTFRGIQHGGL
jgi:hypothetical protein